jgi:hypothetical protein
MKFTKPFYKIKYFIQRGKRGYSDRDMWSADMYMAGIFAGILRWQVENGHGVSMSWSVNDDDSVDLLLERRDPEYIKYAEMFEEYAKNGHAWNKKWKEKNGGLTDDEVHDMMTWFAQHFTEFWD